MCVYEHVGARVSSGSRGPSSVVPQGPSILSSETEPHTDSKREKFATLQKASGLHLPIAEVGMVCAVIPSFSTWVLGI